MIDEQALYDSIGARLKAIRTSAASRSLTQEKLAELVGLERTSITNIEAGKQRVSLHLLYQICIALGIELFEVLPSVRDVANLPSDEMIVLGDKTYSLSPQIAELVRNS